MGQRRGPGGRTGTGPRFWGTDERRFRPDGVEPAGRPGREVVLNSAAYWLLNASLGDRWVRTNTEALDWRNVSYADPGEKKAARYLSSPQTNISTVESWSGTFPPRL